MTYSWSTSAWMPTWCRSLIIPCVSIRVKPTVIWIFLLLQWMLNRTAARGLFPRDEVDNDITYKSLFIAFYSETSKHSFFQSIAFQMISIAAQQLFDVPQDQILHRYWSAITPSVTERVALIELVTLVIAKCRLLPNVHSTTRFLEWFFCFICLLTVPEFAFQVCYAWLDCLLHALSEYLCGSLPRESVCAVRKEDLI